MCCISDLATDPKALSHDHGTKVLSVQDLTPVVNKSAFLMGIVKHHQRMDHGGGSQSHSGGDDLLH